MNYLLLFELRSKRSRNAEIMAKQPNHFQIPALLHAFLHTDLFACNQMMKKDPFHFSLNQDK